MMSEFLDEIEDGSDEDTEAMTAAEVYEKLEEAWMNEKFAPELLENKIDVVECMLEQIAEMEENIEKAKKGDFKISIHRMEIDRIRFVLSSYLRIRLAKIEKNVVHILEQEEAGVKKLSEGELQYAREFRENVESHLKSMALRHMPAKLQTLDSRQTAVRPMLDSYVFLKVTENVEGVMVEEETADSREEIIDLEKGDQHIMRYKPVADLVSSAVSLI